MVEDITNVSGAIDAKDHQMALRSSKRASKSKITVCAKVKMQRQFGLPHQKMKAKLTEALRIHPVKNWSDIRNKQIDLKFSKR